MSVTSASVHSDYRRRAAALQPELVSMRRHIHSHPELSMEEQQTSLFIASQLTEWNIPFTSGWAGYGLVAIIQGNGTGPCVALRADMDALPIEEKNEVP